MPSSSSGLYQGRTAPLTTTCPTWLAAPPTEPLAPPPLTESLLPPPLAFDAPLSMIFEAPNTALPSSSAQPLAPEHDAPPSAATEPQHTPEQTPSAGSIPLFFGSEAVACFGFYHPARTTYRATGVVLCLPVGYEGTCAFETFTALAEELADRGFDVLRFDYHGTGDSPGHDADPDRVGAWQASIRAAISELRRLSGTKSIALVGLRLGATLAADVAASLAHTDAPIDSLTLWAPCVSGRMFTRELKVAAAAYGADGVPPPNADIEALGFLYTQETLQQLTRLDLLKCKEAAAPHTLLIGRDALSVEGALGSHLRSHTDLTFLAQDGLAQIMRDSHQRVVPHPIVDAISGWLCRQHPVTARQQLEAVVLPTAHEGAAEFELVRETPLRFGNENGLFGILTEPLAANAPSSASTDTAILMLNVGTNHRVGPNRLYVKMARYWARAGYRCLRFDLAGMGDSRAASGYASTRLYSKDSVADVQAAIDALQARGCERFVLLGLCSGAYAAFQATLADPRVVAQVLLNPRRLSIAAGDSLEKVMAESYKSRRYYQRALFTPQTYLRFARGELNVRGIGDRMQALLLARLRRMCDRALGRLPSEQDVKSNVKHLCRRGVESLFVVGAEDDGLDYLEFHLGTAGRDVRSARFHLELVHGSDHTFSRAHSQDQLLSFVTEQLNRRLAR